MNRDTLCLTATPDHIGDAVAHVRAACNRAALEQTQRLKVELVVEELFTNTATHGQDAAGKAVTVWLHALGADPGLDLCYEDDGPAFDPTDIAPDTAETQVRRWHIGGLGRALVLFLPTRIRYERREGRNQLFMHFAAVGNAEDAATPA